MTPNPKKPEGKTNEEVKKQFVAYLNEELKASPTYSIGESYRKAAIRLYRLAYEAGKKVGFDEGVEWARDNEAEREPPERDEGRD